MMTTTNKTTKAFKVGDRIGTPTIGGGYGTGKIVEMVGEDRAWVCWDGLYGVGIHTVCEHLYNRTTLGFGAVDFDLVAEAR